MFFTREDINKIHQALLKLGIKDSELPETNDVKVDDTLTIVQDSKNKQINVREFLDQISLWKKESFINITDTYNKRNITLVEAIQTVPVIQRREGLVITFLDNENNWRIYQFRNNLSQFSNENSWVDLYDFTPYITKEELTGITNNIEKEILNLDTKIAKVNTTKVDKIEGKDLSSNDFTNTLKTKLDGIEEGANKTIIDSSLNSTSVNPVQNKVINNALSNKADVSSLSNKVDKITGKGLSANDFTNGHKKFLEELLYNIRNLGHFNTEADAINYLKTLPLCADTKIIHAHLTYGDNNNPNTITLIQNVTASWTRQVLFRGDKIQQRAIYFTNDERTEIRMAEDLQPLFGDRLKWDNNAHKYLLSQFNDNFNGQHTDPIPMASTTTDGLMSKEDKEILNDLNSWNYIGILSSWNGIAKLTTESTEADILTALAITPLRGNKITTKSGLFAILDQCAINKKFLKESSTNANVFVNHIGSCYVIYILGNKASVLNGKLVGTLVLRSITITANSNETLAVLKNPLEINLEDINKKVTNLELEVEKIKEKVAKDLSK